jgi:hypothetical protein
MGYDGAAGFRAQDKKTRKTKRPARQKRKGRTNECPAFLSLAMKEA